jgi:hypothetical protein
MADQDNSGRSYTVGRDKPPLSGQFQKGRSGNPKGRPKGSKNFATTIQSELKRRVTVTEDGNRKKITKREAAAKQLVNRAAAGDLKALPLLLNETRRHESETPTLGGGNFALAAEDDLVIANIIKRIREAQTPPSESAAISDADDPPINTSQSENGNTS